MRFALTLCGLFYALLCLFSIVTGLLYAGGKKELNPLELSDRFMARSRMGKSSGASRSKWAG